MKRSAKFYSIARGERELETWLKESDNHLNKSPKFVSISKVLQAHEQKFRQEPLCCSRLLPQEKTRMIWSHKFHLDELIQRLLSSHLVGAPSVIRKIHGRNGRRLLLLICALRITNF